MMPDLGAPASNAQAPVDKDQMIANLQSACNEIELQLRESISRCARLACERDRQKEATEYYKERLMTLMTEVKTQIDKNNAENANFVPPAAPTAEPI